MKVLSVLAVLVAVTKAGDILQSNVNLAAANNNLKVGAQQGDTLGQGFVGNVFGGHNNNIFGSYTGGGFQPVAAFGDGGGVRLGGDIFSGSGAGFGANVDSFSNAAGGYLRGQAQARQLDTAADRYDRYDNSLVRDASAIEQGAQRRDEQERQGNLQEAEAQAQQLEEQERARTQNEAYNQKAGKWDLDYRRQNDVDSRVGTALGSDGEAASSNLLSNDEAKALALRKTAFTNGNVANELIDYNFDKDFDQTANERGGYQEETGRDNNNVQVYREKQRDHRFANSDNEAFRNANDFSRAAKSQDWLQNALQRQGQNNQHGAADRLQNAAGTKAEDFNTFFDRRDDRIWNGDRARDGAFRGAEDLAAKNGFQNTDAIARSSGRKGVEDNKHYGGRETGDVASGRGGVGGVGYNTDGTNYDDRIGLQGGATGNVAEFGGPGSPGSLNTKGRLEKSGGDVVNAFNENAIQGELSNQLSNSAAESRANAANQYLRDKGLEDAVQQNKANQGLWANQNEGFLDDRKQGYQGDNAEAARAAEALDNSFTDSSSASNLDAANKNFDQAKLDRINQKSNQVVSNQNIRSKKQFYHDKLQDGFNNEGLNYNRRRGDNDFGAQETAQKEARTRSSDLHQNQKNNQGRRRYEDFDTRRNSNGNAAFKQQRANDGQANSFGRARDDAKAQAQGFQKNNARQEFDRYLQQNTQQNSKFWDKANKDFQARNSGNNLGRRTNAAFDYRNTGVGGPGIGFNTAGSSAQKLGAPGFGSANLEVPGGIYTSNSYGVPRGQTAVVGGNVAVAPANAVLNAGNTQFGHYW